MKKFVLMMLCVCVFATTLPGCGGSGENTTVGGDQAAMDDQAAQMKASEEAMNNDPPKM